MLVRKILIGTTVAGILVSSLLWGHMERMKKNELKKEKGRIVEALEASESARLKESESVVHVNKIAEEYYSELQKAKSNIDRIERDPIAVVRVKANCPSVPENGATSSGDNAGTTRLKGVARSDYFDLRRAIEEEREKVIALQNYARRCHALTNQ